MSHHNTSAVYLGDACIGNAPCRLSPVQVSHLLPGGSLLMNENGCSNEAAGLEYTDSGAIIIHRPGRYVVHSCLVSSSTLLSSQPLRDASDTDDHHTHHGERPNHALRDAQFMCGVFGLLMINCIIFFDTDNRLANVKDFAINYASDMLAVGSILVLAEFYFKGKRRLDRRGT